MRRLIMASLPVLLAIGACGGYEPGGLEGKAAAKAACEEFMVERLKAPATAEFGEFTDDDVTYTQPNYLVGDYVDAENGFGAKIRTHYICEVESKDGGESWELIELINMNDLLDGAQ